MNKTILTDADGVLLNWEKGFDNFVSSKGYSRVPGTCAEYSTPIRYGISEDLSYNLIKEFNEGPHVEYLEPFADSVKYVKNIAELGFRFIVVTSISDYPQSKIFRTKNLNNIFGDVFDDVICLPIGACKADVLLRWEGTNYFWIEDNVRQAEAGYKAGLAPILINHPYNNSYESDWFPKVPVEEPWKHIFGWVLNRYLR